MSDPTVTMRELATAMDRKLEQVEAEAAALGLTIDPTGQGRRHCRPTKPGI